MTLGSRPVSHCRLWTSFPVPPSPISLASSDEPFNLEFSLDPLLTASWDTAGMSLSLYSLSCSLNSTQLITGNPTFAPGPGSGGAHLAPWVKTERLTGCEESSPSPSGSSFWCVGFSSCGTQAWLLCSMWDLSSLTRDRICVPCIWRWILNHLITREVPLWASKGTSEKNWG